MVTNPIPNIKAITKMDKIAAFIGINSPKTPPTKVPTGCNPPHKELQLIFFQTISLRIL
jgi:hypothetical protein